ncbi:endonuclease/exonuclease/phosphatase family protein [Pseudoalteromonas gelatinilytica]|uniref:endonuclease/exonuclease/phosphatase family protein n=1 Tax=Pseudoalteromonas gelatinilytica TaxID=1703256 RepID=UPI0007C529EA|nr:endonuclease/exonuclease/phosphatase family protein [Pseudoalteromonas gelatinilytica]
MIENSQLKVATFNLYNYLAPPDAFYDFQRIYSAEQWAKKQRWLADYLKNQQPDIIGFQEVFSINELKQQVNAEGYLYFAVVDEPTVIDDFIYRDPVVAIASRYKIVDVSQVEAEQDDILAMGLSDNFNFSRSIIRATLEVPHLGHVDCYVVHFKSKRSMLYHQDDESHSEQQNLVMQLKSQALGRWASSIQRGSEAALLLVEFIKRRAHSNNPVIVMGDFNNELHDGVLNHLIADHLRFSGHRKNSLSRSEFKLQDSWQLYQRHVVTENDREATHYFGSSSSVFDYILLSREFDAGFQGSFFEVVDYHTYDQHLINPQFAYDDQSTDHGVVMVTMKLRS